MRNPPCILIADDNEMNLDILATRLATHGYEILKAMDGEVALALTQNQHPDLVLLDVMMPKMDGLEVCRRIKQDPSLPFIPVIIVTAKTDSRDIISGLEAGGDEYLTKPVDQAALVARVQSMLKHKMLYDKTEEQAKQLEVQAALLAEKNEELTIQLIQETKLAEIARLLGDIGHDIKNMMMPIITGVGLLEDELSESLHKLQSTERQAIEASQTLSREILYMVRNNAKRIQDRVKEIGDAVKGRSSPPNFSSCQISKVVVNVLETLQFYAGSNKVTLHSNNLESLPLIQADEARLFNACYNLINNAIPETPEGGSVTVTGSHDPELKTVTLSVADTGRGMQPEIRDSLFTNQVISRKVGGTGLGTKIVKDAVDAHNGSIIVETAPNVGTTFHLILPTEQV
jgi:DNA-binding response OmpR family regulator